MLGRSYIGLEVNPEQVDVVVNSHLHFDHIGGNTYRDEQAKCGPPFPRLAMSWQRRNMKTPSRQSSRTHASYNPDDIGTAAGGGADLSHRRRCGDRPGIRSAGDRWTYPRSPSHLNESEGEKAIFLGDLIPTSSHIKPPYVWDMTFSRGHRAF